MRASLQAKVARQARELRRLQEQNENLHAAHAVTQDNLDFERERTEALRKDFEFIRARFNTPQHEHLFAERGCCVLCLKFRVQLRREAEAGK